MCAGVHACVCGFMFTLPLSWDLPWSSLSSSVCLIISLKFTTSVSTRLVGRGKAASGKGECYEWLSSTTRIQWQLKELKFCKNNVTMKCFLFTFYQSYILKELLCRFKVITSVHTGHMAVRSSKCYSSNPCAYPHHARGKNTPIY